MIAGRQRDPRLSVRLRRRARSFVDHAYDCSGSVSYALAAAGLIGAPETSGQLEHWGAPGPGRYLTVFANAGHTFMYVDGVWFDTAGRSGPYSTRWLTSEAVARRLRGPPLPGSLGAGAGAAPGIGACADPLGVPAPPGPTVATQPRSSPLITAPATPPAAASLRAAAAALRLERVDVHRLDREPAGSGEAVEGHLVVAGEHARSSGRARPTAA